ncbi:MAG: hypothetical protein RL168_854 [Bacteroidota bacterium]|jgi:uncharacterized protein (TIGR00661 family)
MQKPLKVLYAFQGTGNGHMARAMALVPHLQIHPEVELTVWISGKQVALKAPFKIHRSYTGITLFYTQNGRIHWLKVLLKNHWLLCCWNILTVPIGSFDLVLNDYEPISAWACRIKGTPILALSHQAAVLHPWTPRPPKVNALMEAIIFWYAPFEHAIGFHFKEHSPHVLGPIVRDEIKKLAGTPQQELLVYLPAFSLQKLLRILTLLELPVYVFHADVEQPFDVENVTVMPIQHEAFTEAFRRVNSVLCGAGFELPTEALYHMKRLAVVPIRGQYEQSCNAAAAQACGAWKFSTLKKKHVKVLKQWLNSPLPTHPVNSTDPSDLVHRVLADFQQDKSLHRYSWKQQKPIYSPGT